MQAVCRTLSELAMGSPPSTIPACNQNCAAAKRAKLRYPSVNPANARPGPATVPALRRARARATWPKITAKIGLRSIPASHQAPVRAVRAEPWTSHGKAMRGRKRAPKSRLAIDSMLVWLFRFSSAALSWSFIPHLLRRLLGCFRSREFLVLEDYLKRILEEIDSIANTDLRGPPTRSEFACLFPAQRCGTL